MSTKPCTGVVALSSDVGSVNGSVFLGIGDLHPDVTPFAAPVPMRAGGLVRPLSMAGGLPGAYLPGELNAVCRR